MESSLVVPSKPKRTVFRKWMYFCLLLIPLTLLLFLVTYPVHKVSNIMAFAFTGSLVLVVASGFLWLMWHTFRYLSGQMDIAFKEIPTPAEIEWRLSQEWGRPATVEEVQAVHQMLTSAKNQAMLNTGIGLAGLYAASRIADGKPVL